uniref:Uracil-DNA glycosylase n=1 Tax=Pithovirus LCDPAC02 TaxID=2506601 RepID=A0A481YQ69_9VIRU|nr:MAG: uracil-DNA glycosylase [Pithovirus LCDPAC02]
MDFSIFISDDDYDINKVINEDELIEFIKNIINISSLEILLDKYKTKLNMWRDFFDMDNIKSCIHKISNKVDIIDVTPNIKKIFIPYTLIKPCNINVVIIGMDPYPQKGYANGIPFSTDMKKCPKSLKEIKNELLRNYPDSNIEGNSLERWYQEGIFLINFAHTTKIGKSGSHLNYWEMYSYKLLEYILNINNNLIICIWGLNIKKILFDFLDKIKKENLFYACHPSRPNSSIYNPFEDCEHFVKINKRLVQLSKNNINWNF